MTINSSEKMKEEELKKVAAKNLYITSDKTQKEIAEMVGWTESTMSKHKRKGLWEDLREAKSLSKQQIISLLHSQTLRIIEQANDEDRILSSKEIDSVAKIAASIDRLEKKASIETYIEVFQAYNAWLVIVNPEHVKVNNELQDRFIQKLIHHESK